MVCSGHFRPKLYRSEGAIMRISKTVERWFEVPDDPDKAEIEIRHLLPGEISDIFDEVFDQSITYKKSKDGSFEPVFSQGTDKKKDRELTLIKCIVDWKNFFDGEGKELKHNDKNIMRASREIEGFDSLIIELRDKLTLEIAAERETQRKNLPGSVSK